MRRDLLVRKPAGSGGRRGDGPEGTDGEHGGCGWHVGENSTDVRENQWGLGSLRQGRVQPEWEVTFGCDEFLNWNQRH